MSSLRTLAGMNMVYRATNSAKDSQPEERAMRIFSCLIDLFFYNTEILLAAWETIFLPQSVLKKESTIKIHVSYSYSGFLKSYARYGVHK